MPSSKVKDISQLNNSSSSNNESRILEFSGSGANENLTTPASTIFLVSSPTPTTAEENVSFSITGTPMKSPKSLMLNPIHSTVNPKSGKSSAAIRLRIRRVLLKMSFIQIILEIIISNVIAIIAAPFIISALLLILLIRLFISCFLKLHYKGRVALMGGADAAWAVQSYAHDNCFVSLYVIQGDCQLSKIKQRIFTSVLERREENCSNEFTYKRMRQRIVQKCGFYCWQDMDEFQIDDHIKYITNDANAEMTEQQVFDEIQSWMDTPLGEDLPQWQILVVPKFIYKNNTHNINNNFPNTNGLQIGDKSHYALVWRMNHAIMDGISASNGLQHCIADRPVRLTVDPLQPSKVPFYVNLLIYTKILIFGSRSFIRSMVVDKANCFHGPTLTGPKTLYWSRPVCMEALKSIKNATRTSTTAVLISCVGGSLRNIAFKKGLTIPKKITAGTTVAILPYPSIRPQNRFTVAHVPITIGLDSFGERLAAAYKSAKELAGSPDVLKNFNLIRLTGLCPAVAIRHLMNNCQATLLLSNIPGPSEYYSIFGGDKLVDTTAWNTIKGKTGIGLCLFSYAGRVRAGFVADAAVLPGASDVATLVEEFENELKELASYTGIPFNSLFTST